MDRCSSTVPVNVKFQSSRMTVHVGEHATVADLKSDVAPKISHPAQDLTLIFSGKVLSDCTALRDLDLGAHSVLHAFCVSGKQYLSNLNAETLAADSPNPGRINYFVYCKVCQCVQPGKLRILCGSCGKSTFVVDRDPDGWDDVLEPKRIGGKCMVGDCFGKLARFYFKCTVHQSQSEEEWAVPLKHIRRNTQNICCIACRAIRTPVLVFPCVSGHVICLDCFVTYCLIQLNDRKFESTELFGYTVPCPAHCPNSYIEESHHFCLMGNNEYERYKRFGAEEIVLKCNGVLCPKPGCGEGILLDGNIQRIVCPVCQYVFCRRCQDDFHQGACRPTPVESADMIYQVNDEQAQNSRWDQDAKIIKQTTKPCPSCNVRTERDGGCMHMKCRCGCEWCWICETYWSFDCQEKHWFG